jgi:hypothetical protein
MAHCDGLVFRGDFGRVKWGIRRGTAAARTWRAARPLRGAALQCRRPRPGRGARAPLVAQASQLAHAPGKDAPCTAHREWVPRHRAGRRDGSPAPLYYARAPPVAQAFQLAHTPVKASPARHIASGYRVTGKGGGTGVPPHSTTLAPHWWREHSSLRRRRPSASRLFASRLSISRGLTSPSPMWYKLTTMSQGVSLNLVAWWWRGMTVSLPGAFAHTWRHDQT